MTQIDLDEMERRWRAAEEAATFPGVVPLARVKFNLTMRDSLMPLIAELRAARDLIRELELEQSRLEFIACGRGYETGKPNEVPE